MSNFMKIRLVEVRVVPCEQKRHDEADTLFTILRMRLKMGRLNKKFERL